MARVKGSSRVSLEEVQVEEGPKVKYFIANHRLPTRFNRDEACKEEGGFIRIGITSYYLMGKNWFDDKYFQRGLKKRRLINAENPDEIIVLCF